MICAFHLMCLNFFIPAFSLRGIACCGAPFGVLFAIVQNAPAGMGLKFSIEQQT
ncbi:hypothetical protein [Agriterribacter sp.]|uniref:hypothetical protein n=1 Tax=Agriterribacter sp. TaxID=2821509 RepID=UPI002BB8D7E8|nr:hypothetical protein [Agriterribacter sp.]HTN09279.1 hypothetical protein [Agriterribacter sp.]